MAYRSLYFCIAALQREETDEPVAYLADNARRFSLITRKRTPDALQLFNLTVSNNLTLWPMV